MTSKAKSCVGKTIEFWLAFGQAQRQEEEERLINIIITSTESLLGYEGASEELRN